MSSLKELLDRYPEAIFPSIWKKFHALEDNGQLYSHIEVLREIENTNNREDKLLQWSKVHKHIFCGINSGQTGLMPEIKKLYELKHWENEINRPGPWADPFLIAMAKCQGATIVTQENKIKPNRIPPIANQLGVRAFNLLEFFSEEGISL